jgi:hypothetical protein
MNTRVLPALGLALMLAGGLPLGAARADVPAPSHDGGRDFDFNLGTWKTHVSRLMHPLAGSAEWAQYDGVSTVRPVWNGRASLFELEAGGPAGHLEGVGLRLYNAQSHQWNLNWTNSIAARLDGAMTGEFRNGRGDFYGQDTFNGRTILVRNSFLDISPDASRFEQAFSDDYGRTWETNWVMTFERTTPAAGSAGH